MNSKVEQLCKALADETRVAILKLLLSGEECSCQCLSESLPVTQPTISHHIQKLINAELIIVRKEGSSHFYQLNRQRLRSIGIDLKKLLAI